MRKLRFPPQYYVLLKIVILSGTPVTVRLTPTCCHGDEKRHHITSRGTIPQDLHTKTRECQVPTLSLQ